MPGIVGAGSLAATAGANYGRTEDATRLLPAAVTAPVETPRKRNPWTWPLIALIAVPIAMRVPVSLKVPVSRRTPTP